jgi:hypothetical protein
MVKDTIALYTTTRVPCSLGNLLLHDGKYVEDIFDAIEDSENFYELTIALRKVINQPLTVDRVTDRYIRYIVTTPFGGREYLKIKIKEKKDGKQS